MKTKETIQLHEIVGYLPWGLKAKDGFNDIRLILSLNVEHEQIMFASGWHDLGSFNPILRPLYDLTKPCLEGGKIPIVEIGKMVGLNLEPYEAEDGVFEYGWGHSNYDDYDNYSFGWCKKLGCFGVWYDEIGDNNPIYQYGGIKEIQKLYEWKFDIHGLIDKGLAIDVNTLETNPYC